MSGVFWKEKREDFRCFEASFSGPRRYRKYKPVLGSLVLRRFRATAISSQCVCVILLCSLDSMRRWRDSARHVLMLVRETVDARAACTSASRIGTMHARGASSSIVTVGISPVSELITSSTSHLPLGPPPPPPSPPPPSPAPSLLSPSLAWSRLVVIRRALLRV